MHWEEITMKSFSNRKCKSIFSIMFVFFTLFFLNAKSLIAEKIKNYEVTVQMNKNGTLTVNEVIDYEFDGVAKHGIYRDIPLRSKKNGVDIYKSYIKMNSIKRNGISEEYSTKLFDEGIRYRVGSADRFVENGVNRYEFNYVIYNAVFEKNGIYQVYFNAIGQFWKVPIEKAIVNIKFGNGKPVTENEISKLQQESGYPYVVNIDTANRVNPIDGKIIMSNLCSEILQVQEPSVINNAQEYEHLGTDISCNLGSTNIVNLMKSPDFERSIDVAVRALTFVTDHSSIDAVPTVKNGNSKAHTIGLGAMGLHTFFALNQMKYGSPESIEATDLYFRMLNFYTLKASNKIAKERGQSFVGFERSKYATGEYFDSYIAEEVQIQSDKVKKIFEKLPIPTVEDWKQLKEDVMSGGLYHQNRLAIAPTGSISYVNETSASLHPITRLIEERQEKKTGKTYYPAPFLSNDTLPFYKSAYDIDMRKVIDVYAAAQKHIDQGMSLTLFMRSELPEGLYEWKEGRTNKMTTRDLNILRNYAWNKGIKSIYYVRTFTENNDEIGSNACESCSI